MSIADADTQLFGLKHNSVLKNSSMSLWSPDQGLKDPLSAVFWPWFGGVGFVFDPPTGQIATFSTGCCVLTARAGRSRIG